MPPSIKKPRDLFRPMVFFILQTAPHSNTQQNDLVLIHVIVARSQYISLSHMDSVLQIDSMVLDQLETLVPPSESSVPSLHVHLESEWRKVMLVNMDELYS